MAKIKIDVAALRENSRGLELKIQELNVLNKNLDSLISRIESSWEGEASTAYINMMRFYENKANSMVEILTEFKSYIDSAVIKFEDVDNASASNIRNSF